MIIKVRQAFLSTLINMRSVKVGIQLMKKMKTRR